MAAGQGTAGIEVVKGVVLPREHDVPEGALRQSMLAKLDECTLSAYFEVHGQNFNTHPQAAGILFHRVAAEILRTLRRVGEEEMPTQEAIEILYEVARQRGVPPGERIRCSMRDLALVRLGVVKLVTDNRFSIRKIVSIEERLNVPIVYRRDDGVEVQKMISGKPDALLAESVEQSSDTAVVLDWKLTWALPPERKEPTENEFGAISYEGYFQQRVYAFLVMLTYPTIQAVRLREYYPLRGKVRSAVVTRDRLEHIEREIAMLAYDYDRLVAEDWEHAEPTPGKHCGFCRRPERCPLEGSERGEGAINSQAMAERYAAEREVAEQVRKRRTDALKVWVSNHGPVRIKASKERREIGWRIGSSGGRNFGPYVPDAGDVALERDEVLEAQMRASTREARELRRRAATG